MICEDGYSGVLCAVCDASFFYDAASNLCQECSGVDVLTPTAIVAIVTIFLVLLATAVYMYYIYIVRPTLENVRNNENAPEHMDHLNEISNWFDSRFGPIMSKVKILTATFQIVSSSSSSLQVALN